MSDEPRRLIVILHWIESALLVVAILALGWYAAIRISTIVQQAQDRRMLERLVARREPAIPPAMHPALSPPTFAPDSMIGRLDVPRLGISVIVREGTEPGTLRRAVGHIAETALPGTLGNAALAGHRDTFFRKLKSVRAGDRVVMTMANRTVTYVVRTTRVIEPTETSILDETQEPTLTLVTCYPFTYIGAAPNRFVVRAVAARHEIAPPIRPASDAITTSSTAGVAAAPAGTSGLDQTVSHASGSPKRARSGAKKSKANAAARGKKAEVENTKKRGFWRKLGGFLIGR